MVLYECFRCGYSTKLKGNMNHHLNRKNICNPTEDDICIDEIKKYYGFEITENMPQKTTNVPQNTSIEESQNTTFLPQNTTKIYQCKYCNKILSRYDSLNRHIKTCKKKKEAELLIINQNEEHIKIQKESENIKEEIKELKEKIIELVNKDKMLEIKLDNKTDELDYNYRQCMSLNKKLRKENKV